MRGSRITLVLIIILLFTLLIPTGSALLSGWTYYQAATINNTGSNLTNYQMMFIVNTSSGTSSGTTIYLNSHSESDLDDLRFTSTSDTLYDYWIEDHTTNPNYTVWVEIPSILNSTSYGSTTLWVQYGNSGASAVSNITNTMIFGDNFSGDLSKWSGDTGAFASGSGTLNNTPTSSSYNINHAVSVANTVLEARIKTTDASTDLLWGICYEIDGSNRGLFTRRDVDAGSYTRRWGDGATYYSSVPPQWTSGTYGRDTVIIKSTVALSTHKFDGTTVSGATNFPSGIADGVSIKAYGLGTPGVQYMDWILLRTYTATEPTVSSWSGENMLTAAFSGNITYGYPPFYVQFTDESSGTPTSWNWTFEDGGYSSERNATHWYNVTIGNTITRYDVSLNASTATGYDIENKSDYITAYPLNTSWSSDAITGCTATTFTFTDLTNNGTPTSWNWSFGDGSYSNLQNPTHVYSTTGVYTINLNSSNTYSYDWENKSSYVAVYNCTEAFFVGSPTCGNATLEVFFADFSTGDNVDTWNWSFGDGNFSELRNSVHNYTYNGNFTVNLTAWGDGGYDTYTRSEYIQVPCNTTTTPTPTPTPTTTTTVVVSGGQGIVSVRSASDATGLTYPLIIFMFAGIAISAILGMIVFNRRRDEDEY